MRTETSALGRRSFGCGRKAELDTIKLISAGEGLPLRKRLLSSEPQSTDPPEGCFPRGLPISGSGEPPRDNELGGVIPVGEVGYNAPCGLAVIGIVRGG